MIALKSENQILKKYIKENQSVNVLQKQTDSVNQNKENLIVANTPKLDDYYLHSNNRDKINQIFQTLNNNLNTYYYSYSKHRVVKRDKSQPYFF